jgi:hypothetical protein
LENPVYEYRSTVPLETNLNPSSEESSFGLCPCQLIRADAVDTICIQHVRQGHDAFQFVNIRPVDDWQDIEIAEVNSLIKRIDYLKKGRRMVSTMALRTRAK